MLRRPSNPSTGLRDATPLELQVIAFNAANRRDYEMCARCAVRLPARHELPRFVADVVAERARLAMLDPDGESEAIVPLDGVKARQIALHLSEPIPHINRPVAQASSTLDERQLLQRLGVDIERGSGLTHCPGPRHGRGDRNKSLSWRWTGEKALLHCFASCEFDEIRAAL